jgi:hypothetical protein
MLWKEVKNPPLLGTRRLVKKFAWLPTRVHVEGEGAYKVWLQYYWRVELFDAWFIDWICLKEYVEEPKQWI